jgi:predicted dehydrogenase
VLPQAQADTHPKWISVTSPLAATAAPIGVAVIGAGYWGPNLVRNFQSSNEFRLRWLCDLDVDRARRVLGGYSTVDTTGELATVLADDNVDAVAIATPAGTHLDVAMAALAAGKHVLVEKPVALRERAAARLAAAARAARTLCLPAMCMRFWPGWNWLRDAVADGRYGTVRSAAFRRLGSHPGWASSFYADPRRSGGALFDLHVHDADFITWLFGMPRSVSAAGTHDHVTTQYRFEHGPAHVVAEAGWDHDPGMPFRMAYTLVFEHATADFDGARDPALRLFRDGHEQPVELPAGTGYDGEVRHLLTAIAHGAALQATCDEAQAVTRLLAAEEASLRSGQSVDVAG